MISCENTKKAPGWECTGSDESKAWDFIHNEVPKKIDCDYCKGHYEADMEGYHDVINVGLGKPALKPEKLFEFQEKVNTAITFCKQEGLCKI